MSHIIEFPQDVNTELLNEREVGMFDALTRKLSPRQAYWTIATLRDASCPEEICTTIALAEMGGPELHPVTATIEEINAHAKGIFERVSSYAAQVVEACND